MNSANRFFNHTLRPLLVAAALLNAVACALVAEEPVLRVLATDPGTDAVLGAQQRFHVKFELVSKTPLVVTLDPYFQRELLSANLGTSAPIALPAGGGSAVAHLFFWGDYATRVDEIRLVARAPKQVAPRAELALPVKLSWVARAVAPREPAAWVNESQKSAAQGPLSALDDRSQWLAFGAVIAAIAAGGFGSRWLRKRWRAQRRGD
jgi:hypothetical protein